MRSWKDYSNAIERYKDRYGRYPRTDKEVSIAIDMWWGERPKDHEQI